MLEQQWCSLSKILGWTLELSVLVMTGVLVVVVVASVLVVGVVVVVVVVVVLK